MSEMETPTIISVREDGKKVEKVESMTIQKIEGYTNLLDKWLESIAMLTLIISTALALVGVVMRYFFDSSLQVLEELSRYSIIYGVFLYAGPLIKKAEHIRMDLMDTLLKGKKKILNELLISLITACTYAYLFWSGYKWVASLFEMRMMTTSGTMLIIIPTFAIPLGMCIGFVYSIQQIIINVYNIVVYENRRK
jgi:TRAP-type C4-dicarboxylate transport system permease small subunit